MNEIQKHYVEWKKSDMKECSILIPLIWRPNKQNRWPAVACDGFKEDTETLSGVLTCSISLFKIIYLLNIFLAALGLHCCKQAFFSCGECRGVLSSWGILRASYLWWFLSLQSLGSRHASFISCGSRALDHRFSSCGAWA